MSAECPLTELPADQCACRHHRGGHAPGQEPLETVGGTFVAAYPGDCARSGCDGVEPGDEITRVVDSRSYIHVRCAR